MRSLQGVISDIETIRDSARLRFRDSSAFVTPEALILWEQNIVSSEELLKLCKKEYGDDRLELPTKQYLPTSVVEVYKDTKYLPISYSASEKVVQVITIPEFESEPVSGINNCSVDKRLVPIFYYVEQHLNLYGTPAFLYELPPRDLFEFIKIEALQRKAIDITLSTARGKSYIYYDINKQKEYSSRVLTENEVLSVMNYLSAKAGRPNVLELKRTKDFSVNLDKHFRGRCMLARTEGGYTLTIRVLPTKPTTASLDDWNIKSNAVSFMKTHMASKDSGLRILCGETLSGKNTTILAILREMLASDTIKAISVEKPVEVYIDGMEQMSAESETEFKEFVDSLIRQNPGLVYASEMTAYTTKAIIELANTGKIAFSTVHVNNAAGVISRLAALSNMDLDEIVINMHSVVYQKLIRDKELGLKPINTCILFTEELKNKLIGKSRGEIYKVLREEELAWESTCVN